MDIQTLKKKTPRPGTSCRGTMIWTCSLFASKAHLSITIWKAYGFSIHTDPLYQSLPFGRLREFYKEYFIGIYFSLLYRRVLCKAKGTSDVPTLHPLEISSAFSCDSDATQDPLVAIEFSALLHSQNQQPLPTAAPLWDDFARPMLVSFLMVHENAARSTLKRRCGLESLINLRVYIQGDLMILQPYDTRNFRVTCFFPVWPCNTLHCVVFWTLPLQKKKTKIK